ncbi:MAG: hypothetical protein J7M12_04500 [Candidatus Hydrogenedentes bacterium]|nr:hypothetical protein [Candidatus Hydrogenedentota bacterium]
MATKLFSVCLLILMATGCATQGLLVTDVTRPLMTDFDKTPVGNKKCVMDTHLIREPFFHSSVEWTDNTIEPRIKRAGITELRHADLHTFSLFGIYRRQSVVVYGD